MSISSPRTSCIVCEGSLKEIVRFEKFPVYMGISNHDEDTFQDMIWSVCESCGCVQLLELIDPEVLYLSPHNPAIGKTWELHNVSLSNVIKHRKPNNVLDIGGANLKLAHMVLEENSIKKYTVLDFSSDKYELHEVNDKITMIRGRAEDLLLQEKYDLVLLSHTLEHIYDPVKLLRNIREMLTDSGVVLISVPHIRNQIEESFLNALHFEHTYFIDHEYIGMIANAAGFSVQSMIDFSKYNSFYVFEKSITFKSVKHSDGLAAERHFMNFVDNVRKDASQITCKLFDEKCYIFGAHIFSQYLINFGLLEEKIVAVLDNDPAKIGKRLYGTNLRVQSPDIIKNVSSPCVVLRTAQYRQEIEEQIFKINQGAVII